jgi:hypothetical protein
VVLVVKMFIYCVVSMLHHLHTKCCGAGGEGVNLLIVQSML